MIPLLRLSDQRRPHVRLLTEQTGGDEALLNDHTGHEHGDQYRDKPEQIR
jgi:hypothetical protein